ncbi:MAG TPA: Maf family protein [Propionibacteriaceae bacterium]|nr:Maf family protein [Propionibacteriaceae bacterium]
MRLVLASASPARLDTLRRAGVHPTVVVSDIDESLVEADDIRELVSELARRKAESVAEEVLPADDVVVVGCDSLLEVDGSVYGKPGTPENAVELWGRLAQQTGLLVTGHHVIVATGGTVQSTNRTAETLVHFADLTEAEIQAYAATGEPEAVAGGFTIDGYGGAFITGIEGDPHNVVGISLPLLRMMLADLGVTWHDLWNEPA